MIPEASRIATLRFNVGIQQWVFLAAAAAKNTPKTLFLAHFSPESALCVENLNTDNNFPG